MADRVLPSREDVRLVLDREYDEYAKSVGWLLMGAYAEGRLVDREAIDRRAAGVAVAAILKHPVMTVNPLKAYPPAQEIADAAIDAALGDV